MHAIILVGGRGTRLQPLTDSRPKPMLPILGAPFLEHQLLYLKGHGVTAVTFACGFLPDEIRSYFGDGERLGLELTYAIEPEPLDTAGAIAFAAREFGLTDRRLLVCNGDVLTDLDVSELIAAHDAHDATATIALTPVEDPTRYGLVRTGDDDEVLAFLEKPTLEEAGVDRYINAGTYVLEPEVFELVPEGARVNIEREVFPKLVGRRLHAIGFDGYWNDIGTFESYRRANADAAAGRIAGIAPSERNARRWVSPDAKVASGADVGAGSVVLAGAVVEDGAELIGSVVLEGAFVGREVFLEDVIVGEGARIEPAQLVAVGDVIGPGVGSTAR
ncbi:MAG: GDP-mannose pyrophosphorylase [Thermoleophilia bacterium]|nr:GDP-mannose pyrophosphorylase [Thermoleophilia bacterium]